MFILSRLPSEKKELLDNGSEIFASKRDSKKVEKVKDELFKTIGSKQRLICLIGVLKRRFLFQRVDDIPGYPERIDFGFLSWIWNYNKTQAPGIIKKLESLDNKAIYILKNRRELQKLLRNMKLYGLTPTVSS